MTQYTILTLNDVDDLIHSLTGLTIAKAQMFFYMIQGNDVAIAVGRIQTSGLNALSVYVAQTELARIYITKNMELPDEA